MGIKSTTTTAEAARVLHSYEADVADVRDTPEGVVATTVDGQRYLLTSEVEDGFVHLLVEP